MEHLNTDMLAELKNLMEDEFGLLVDTYCSDGQLKVTALGEAVAAGEAEKIREMAHSLKGSSSNLGAEYLSDMCCRLEAKGKQGDLANVESMYAEIKQEFEHVKSLIQKI